MIFAQILTSVKNSVSSPCWVERRMLQFGILPFEDEASKDLHPCSNAAARLLTGSSYRASHATIALLATVLFLGLNPSNVYDL